MTSARQTSPNPDRPILTDPGLILAKLLTGAELTICYHHSIHYDGHKYYYRAFLDKWKDSETEIPYQIASGLQLSDLLDCTGGNFETGEQHFWLRVHTAKKNGKWRLDVQRETDKDRAVPFVHPNLPALNVTDDDRAKYFTRCEVGCKRYAGGEVYHTPGCTHYAGSMSERLDALERRNAIGEATATPDDLAGRNNGFQDSRLVFGSCDGVFRPVKKPDSL